MKPRSSALAAFALAAVLCTPAAAAPYKTSFGPTTVDISTGHAGHSSIPQHMGYWKDGNLEVDVFGAAGAPAGLQMVAAGKMDFITVTPEALMLAQAQGMPVKAVYVHARRPISKLVVLEDSPVQSIADLKGKAVGQPVIETSSAYFGGVFNEAGLKFGQDVKVIATGTGAPAALAMQRGDIAAWASWDTAVASLENRGLSFREFQPSYYDQLIGNVIVTRQQMIDEHPEVVIAMAKGIAQAVHFGLQNPEAAVKIHWTVYPQTRPQNPDAAAGLAEAKGVFVSRFSSYDLGGQDRIYGNASPEQWDTIARLMREAGSPLPESYDPQSAFTDQFIEAINDFDRGAVEQQAAQWKE